MSKSASTEQPLTLSLSLKGRGDAVATPRPKAPLPLRERGRGEGSTGQSVHLHRIRVCFEDTDAGGMVYYANYLKFAERARTEMLRAAGVSHAEMVTRDGLMLVVRRCEAEYLQSARLDDELTVETRIVEIGGASVELEQRIHRDAELLVTLKVLIACINKAGRVSRLPDYLRRAMRRDHLATTDK